MSGSPKRRQLRSSTENQRPVLIHNRTSILSLPTELILHIASTYPTVNYLADDIADQSELYFERRNALRALSQTSRALRNMVLHLLWECFETVYHRGSPDYWAKFTADKLERLSKGLLGNPEIAAHVRIAVISIPYSASCKSLVRCILSLFNLHTLCISLHGLSDANPFFSARFPQIRTLKIPAYNARLFIPCCPKVRAVISSARMPGGHSLRDLFNESEKSLEELDGFTLSESDVEYIVKVAPNLHKIRFVYWIPPNTIRLLGPLNHLQAITMSVREKYNRLGPSRPRSTEELDTWMATAVSVLQGNRVKHGSNGGEKRVRMDYTWVNHSHTGDGDNKPKSVERIEDVTVE